MSGPGLRACGLAALFALTAFHAVLASDPGWQNAAMGGGGRGLSTGSGALFGNPAATGDLRLFQAEAGASHWDGSGIPSLWSGALIPVGERNFLGLAFWEADPQSAERRRGSMTVSGQPFANSRWGLRGSLQRNPEETQLDLDAGLHLRLARTWQAGFTAAGITESLDPSPAWQSHRVLGGGLAYLPWGHEGRALWFDFAQYNNGSSLSLSQRAGLRLGLGPREELRLAGSVGRYSGGAVRFSAGISVRQPIFGSIFSLGYAVEDIPFRDSGSVRHAATLALTWNAFADQLPPRPFLRAEPVVISPAEGVADLPRDLHFILRVDEETGLLQDWHLALYRTDSQLRPVSLLRVFRGEGFPPRTIRWGGEDAAGTLFPPGVYAAQLVVRDRGGNQARTSLLHLEIR